MILTSIGFTLVLFGVQVRMVPVELLKDQALIEPTTFTVAEVVEHKSEIPGNVTVKGAFKSTLLATGKETPINLYVMTADNYEKWREGEKTVSYALRVFEKSVDKFNFSTGNDGTYYFVFANNPPVYVKSVSFEAYYEKTVMSEKPTYDYTLKQIGWILVAVGTISSIYGLMRKQIIPWQ